MSRIPVNSKNKVKAEARKRRNADLNVSRAIPDTADINAIIAQYLIDNPVGGSVGKLVGFDSDRIAAGASGAVLTRTATGEQYYKITYLLTNSAASESGMTLEVDGVSVFNNAPLSDGTPAHATTTGIFGISAVYATSAPANSSRILRDVYCKTFTLTKVAGTTNNPIDYAYETLEPL